jgi:lipopolysaccharide biosynthesis glycosyltransferase
MPPASAEPDPIRLATAINARYLPFAAALVSTLAESRAPTTRLELTVLHAGDVADADRARLADLAGGVALRWHVVTADDYARHGLRLAGLLAQPQYFRCVLPDILPPTARRAIYLDADTMVLSDLTELHELDLDGAPVAAVLDWLPTVREAVAPWQALGLDGDAPYFNSGVLLMDLGQWRSEDAGARALRRCLADERHLAAQGQWMQHDQYGLNVVFHRRWRPLAPVWNHFAERPADSPRIVHLVGNGKPWNSKCQERFADAFYAAVDRSPWAGWRGP